jgi:hypothetical protein
MDGCAVAHFGMTENRSLADRRAGTTLCHIPHRRLRR